MPSWTWIVGIAGMKILIMIQKNESSNTAHRGPDANCSEAINDHIYFGHLDFPL